MKFEIRTYHITDLSSLYRICLLTGYNGGDASSYLKDPDLTGHLFAAPYAIFEPNLCFVLTLNSTPCGYILGTRDSITFYNKCEKKWFPELRQRYPLPQKKEKSLEANFIRHLHRSQIIIKELDDYPAHLHIDILPIAQRKGYGRKLIKIFLNQLQSQDVQGVHLIVNKNNQNAIKFYQQIGFQELKELEDSIAFGKKL
tara:strand:+ start:790 stop:1386 length:597 start_codon:yes stop_codon:yes gene_type:complete